MKIESVDLFYLAMPEITTDADGSQDALLVRVRSGEREGRGEFEAARWRQLPDMSDQCHTASAARCATRYWAGW